MADAIIGATIQILLEKTISLAAERFGFVLGFKNDLQELQKYASKIQAVLADAEAQQTESQEVRLWLKEVEKVAFEADNVLDELSYESLRRKVKSRNTSNGGKVCLFFSLSKHDISFRWRMGSKVRDINTKLKSFNLEANQIGLKILAAALRPTTEAAISRETNSLVPKFVVGRAKEESEIVDKLLGYSGQNVFVLPIVGMGGLGKTTLAKSVYNNQQFDGHFTKKIWICVSDEFEVTKLFRAILESLKKEKVEMAGQDAIVQDIRKELDGKKFLLVLDDVWTEIPDLWNKFYDSLEGLNSASGSCCMLTTRKQTTAKMVSRGDLYPLNKLSDDDCWSILTQKATLDGGMPEVLDDYKGEILSRCQGLPLAASAIGGLLYLQKREDWLSFVKNKILKVSGEHKDGIMPILKLSFDNLPSPFIKKCFAYCSIFAKDTILKEDELIKLWMAEGFLQANAERGTMMEEIGGNYFRILMQSSLLEEGDYEGEYQMHDLVHDLATMVSRAERLNVDETVVMEEINHDQVRYLAIDSFGERTEKTLNAMSPLLIRTLFVNTNISSVEMLLRFEYLHVLNFSGRETVKDLPNSISVLKHLRYLDLSHSKIKKLPESLCKLYHLQTLRLDLCSKLQGLPKGMKNLISLRHLHTDTRMYRYPMPLEMGRLTCLQTLEFFNIGEGKGCGIEELGPMEKLKGRLKIRNLELVKGKEGAKLANLFGKQNLIDLEFRWGSRDNSDGDCDEQVLEGLEPHPNLQRFTIRYFMGARFPQWLGSLTSLVDLTFQACKNCTELPSMGHLPCLEYLIVEGLDKVNCIGASFYGIEEGGGGKVLVSRRKVFPALKVFKLERLSSLVEWKEVKSTVGDDAVVVFPKLERLYIEDCDQLATAPTHFSSLQELEIVGNVQVLVVKNVLTNGGALKYLTIRNMDGLTCLYDVVELQRNNIIFNNYLTSLETLRIKSCHNLISIPSETLEGCRSLEQIWVVDCKNLKSFPFDLKHTPSLSKIGLSGCPKLFTNNEMPKGFGHLSHLRLLCVGPFSDDSFQLFDWSGVVCCSSTLLYLSLSGDYQVQTQLPNQLQHFTSLTELTIENYLSLETLPDWFGNLASLVSLKVKNCPKLQYLPSIDCMRNLTKLERLEFTGCPLLNLANCIDSRFIKDLSYSHGGASYIRKL